MENLYGPERSANWVRPNMEGERSEVERTLREFIGIEPNDEEVERMLKIIESSPVVDLEDEEWEKLDNTDSFHNVRFDHIEDAEKITEELNSDASRGYQRNVGALKEAFASGAEMEVPVILKNEKGEMHLVSGNTRLMVARALGIRPKVIIAEFKEAEFNIETSPLREVYELLGAKTPFNLELSNKYSDAEQPVFISQEWDYDNPDQIQNRVKTILESVDPETLTDDEKECRQEMLWFWYHHATSCAIWKKDREKAIEYPNKALELQGEGHPNKITKILSLLVNDKLEEAEEFVKTVETDGEEAEGLIEDYKLGRFF